MRLEQNKAFGMRHLHVLKSFVYGTLGGMVKVALYGRVSTKAEKGLQNPEVQLRELRKFAATQKWKVCATFVDHESGGKSDRPSFRKMMECAAKHEFDVLLFWSLDRYSREGIVPVQLFAGRTLLSGVRPCFQQET
jgi:DNA invertase Pin-like site-specific DNA recombinase